MELWEYKSVSRELEGGYWTIELGEELAELGRQGWELIATYPVEQVMRTVSPSENVVFVHRAHFVFKRELGSRS